MEARFEVRDQAFRKYVGEGVTIEHLATGFQFTEGPVWLRGEKDLLFSDIPSSRIVRYRFEADGPHVTTYRHPSGNANGHTLDRQGRLVSCEHSGRRVSRTEADGRVDDVAARFEGKRLNSPNDVVVKSDGAVYFTDPPYGLKNYTEGKELAVNGVYRVAPDGAMTLLAEDFERPNGLAFSPDESILYIDDSAHRHIRAFDVRADGTLANGRLFLDMAHEDKGSPDGMKVDVEGNVWCTGPGAVWLITPDAKVLGRIVCPEQPANLAWGDDDGRSLYITARTSLYRLRTEVQGIRV
ncbi:MAG: SMP-30/gluconolactonase/LRE family protein [Candidatus Latescibacteria bacterium]|nr:SMP-30/gluconolactonase/LRE family protein [Candidatus Latescibacterota bacterium]